MSPYLTHRHPDYWDDPEVFNPERFTPERVATRHRYAYFPFGGGPHLCIGNHFAMMEAQLVLATIAQRYRLHSGAWTTGRAAGGHHDPPSLRFEDDARGSNGSIRFIMLKTKGSFADSAKLILNLRCCV